MAQAGRITKRTVLDVLPFLAFFAALFFADMSLFGVSDALIGIVFLFFSKAIVYEPGLSPVNYARRCGWFFLMALCATLAGLHPIAMVIVTVLYLFVMTVLNSDDYLPRNYFWLGLGYLLLLIYPVDVNGIGMRLVATLFSLAWTTAFVYLMRFFLARSGALDIFARDRNFVRRAFDECAAQLEDLATGEADAIDPKRVFDIAQEYTKLEYGTVYRQDGLLSGRQSYTFALLICIEQIAYNTHAASAHYHRFDEEEKSYYLDLAEVLRGFGKGRINTVIQFADELQDFLSTHHLAIEDHDESWRGILESMLRTVRDTRMSRDTSTPFFKSVAYRLYYLRDNINLQNTQTRFALQLSAIVGIAMLVDMVVTQYAGAIFGIWIPITAFTILNTYNDETLKATADNFIGTMIGIGVFALVVHFIPAGFRMPLVIVLSYGLMLFNLSPAVNVAAGTQIALTALYPYLSLESTLFSRLVLVILAVTCVMMVIFGFMHTRRAKTISAKIRELERIDVRLVKSIRKGLERGEVNFWRTVQLLYYLHMDAELLSRLSRSITSRVERQARKDARRTSAADAEDTPSRRQTRRARARAIDEQLAGDVNRCLDLNYRFTMGAAHAVMLLDPRRAEPTRWRTGTIYPDSPVRLQHLDDTVASLDQTLRELEDMRYLEHADQPDASSQAKP
ncbi:MAG: FUSC family protein [Eggerthellaceae bacterium]|jgi:hypothetical protein